MCLIAYAWKAHPRWPLVLIGNRDEFHGRPTAAAEFLDDAPEIYGGRDLEKLGGWLQLSSRRRLAAVTNVRDGTLPEIPKRSRGALVSDFVRDARAVADWLAALATGAAHYGRFNLLAWDGESLAIAGNHPGWRSRAVAPGVHGLSNGDFDAPWPKSVRAREALRTWIEAVGDASQPDPTPLFDTLADERTAPDDELPETGVGLDLERLLSAGFIRGARYGTRCSSVVLVGADGARFSERRFGPDGVVLGERKQDIAWAPA